MADACSQTRDSCVPSREEMLAALEKRQGKDAVRKLQATTVAVCGLGGLGSNIAISLARAGVGKLILIDFDRVDVTNLHRQQYKANQVGMPKPEALLANLKEVAPYTEFEMHFEKVTADNAVSLLAKADLICEAFDNAEAKAMLVNTVLENMPEKFLVAASGMAGYASGNSITTRKVTKRFYVCGDGKSDVNDGIGLIAPRVMLCAAHQALTAIRLILGLD
ncbi:thiamine biosynthesis protein ThiF [uncultured Fibrobacter sp.]|uniref:thiamine biosynthesis protein ThiF n=1 Tax=uncultured Fibrobacter sp. TaxID=261512 RepID=UPI0026042387|nr:thiamine biosynthesis protein ThiF [uncultured Fibrobacter sp.]